MNLIDLSGQRFFKLTVLRRELSGGEWRWLCACDCGNSTFVTGGNLRSKRSPTKSCGCHRELVRATACRTHNEGSVKNTVTCEYNAWSNIKGRCNNPNNKVFRYYGGRGIKVCDRWNKSYPNFLQDVGRRPGPGYTIDRIDNDGDYEPGNCRWATRAEQANNTRANVMVVALGRSLTLAQWGKETGMHWATIRTRLDNGWEPDRAVSAPLMANRRNRHAKAHQ